MSRIAHVAVEVFRAERTIETDEAGLLRPGRSEAPAGLLRVRDADGLEGVALGDDPMVDEALAAAGGAIGDLLAQAAIGHEALARERVHERLRDLQRLHGPLLSDRVLALLDVALWDLVGKAVAAPVAALAGGDPRPVPAYASTMCGDAPGGGLDSPEAFADFAEACRERGYRAFKLHTWQPPAPGAPNPDRDIAACAAVRERVGDRMELMLDPYHFYSRHDAKRLGDAVAELGFLWLEEPMDERTIEAYRWLRSTVAVPIAAPESAPGGVGARAAWITAGACDLARAGVLDVGGITPVLKTAHVCEALGAPLTLHLGGLPSVHAAAAAPPGVVRYHEHGLLHPDLDAEAAPPWLQRPAERLDDDGRMVVPDEPGIGLALDEAYVRDRRLASHRW